MGMISSFFHPERGYKKGQEKLDKYYQESQGYLQPIQQQGQEAYGHLSDAMQNLMNPSQFYDQMLGNYQQSDASQFAQERARQSGLNNLSAMGMLGSTPGLQALQAGTAQIGAEDQERYMKQMIDQYIQGAGLAQGIYGQGAQAAGQMGQNAQQMGQGSAQMAFGAQNAPGELFNNLLNTAISVAVPAYGMARGLSGGMNQGGAGASPQWSTNR